MGHLRLQVGMMMRLRVHLQRHIRKADSSAGPLPADVSDRREDDAAAPRYRKLRSLLRRNQRMFAVEADWVRRHAADRSGDTLADLLLYEFLGHRSKRSRRRQAQMRRRQIELNRIQFQLEKAGAALEAGLLTPAEGILRRTSHRLGILLEDDVARLRPAPARGGPLRGAESAFSEAPPGVGRLPTTLPGPADGRAPVVSRPNGEIAVTPTGDVPGGAWSAAGGSVVAGGRGRAVGSTDCIKDARTGTIHAADGVDPRPGAPVADHVHRYR